jgi:hypothetical protein
MILQLESFEFPTQLNSSYNGKLFLIFDRYYHSEVIINDYLVNYDKIKIVNSKM